MSKVAVVYYSMSGNTQMMAEAVARGAENAGAEVSLVEASSFDAGEVSAFDAIAFGCPAMGSEVLEEGVFEPMFASLESSLNGKKVGLFGSYGWGVGQWMHDWEDRVRNDGANLVQDGVMANYTPDEGALQECEALGQNLA